MQIRKIEKQRERIAMLGAHPEAKLLADILNEQGRYEAYCLDSPLMLWELIKAGKHFDLYHAHTPLSALAAKAASWWTGVPVVAHVHHPPANPLTRVAFLETHYTQMVSESEAFLKQKNVNEPLMVIPPVFLGEELEAKQRENCFEALYHGPLDKSVDVLLKALRKMLGSADFIQTNKDFRLHIVPTKGNVKALRQQTKKMGIGRFVRFHKKAYRNKVDLFVYPALQAGMPQELMLACAQGLPILATRTGDIPKLVQDNVNGHLVPAGNVDELSYYLLHFALNPGLEKMGAESRRIVNEKYKPEEILEKWMKVYKNCMATKHLQEDNSLFMPWEMPKQWAQGRKLNSNHKGRKALRFCVTVNVEQAYANASLPHEVEHVEQFLKRFSELAEQQDFRSTFFVQRDLFGQFLEPLKAIESEGHEIAVHALASDWVDSPTRKKSIREIREEQKSLGLSPRMFRAPSEIEEAELQYLHEQNFEYLPVTQDPLPHTSWRFGLPFGRSLSMTLEQFLELSNEDLLAAVNRLRNYQKEHGIDPFLIFECHSWEFQSRDHAAHASGENYSRLAQKLALLRQHMDLEFMNLSEFCTALEAIDSKTKTRSK